MQTAEALLEIIHERGKRGLPLERLYRHLFNPELYLRAYGKIYRNDGAMTPGVDAEHRIKQARVAVGSCSAVAQRLVELEQRLAGVRVEPGFTNRISHQQLATLSPIDDVRATADYRRDAAFTLVKRALEACVEER